MESHWLIAFSRSPTGGGRGSCSVAVGELGGDPTGRAAAEQQHAQGAVDGAAAAFGSRRPAHMCRVWQLRWNFAAATSAGLGAGDPCQGPPANAARLIAAARGSMHGGQRPPAARRPMLTLRHAELLSNAHDAVARGHHIGLTDACSSGRAGGRLGRGCGRATPGRSGSRQRAGGLAPPGPDAAAAVRPVTAPRRPQAALGGGRLGWWARGAVGDLTLVSRIASEKPPRPSRQCWVGLQVHCAAGAGGGGPHPAWRARRPGRTATGPPGPPHAAEPA